MVCKCMRKRGVKRIARRILMKRERRNQKRREDDKGKSEGYAAMSTKKEKRYFQIWLLSERNADEGTVSEWHERSKVSR